jgi:hypothetical protein
MSHPSHDEQPSRFEPEGELPGIVVVVPVMMGLTLICTVIGMVLLF